MIRTILVKANERYAPAYRTSTRITRDTETGAFGVVKAAIGAQAQPHIQAMADGRGALDASLPRVTVCPCWMEDDGLHFEFIQGKSYLKTLQELCEGNKETYLAAWRRFFELLMPADDRLCPFETSESFERFFGPGEAFAGETACRLCAIDQTPSNLIDASNDRFVLIDYEWVLNVPVPLGLLRYHALVTTCRNHPELTRSVPLKELLPLVGMTAPRSSYERALECLIGHISAECTANGQELYMAYAKPALDLKGAQQLIQQTASQQEVIGQQHKAIQEQEQEIQRLYRELHKTQFELRKAWGSLSWKLTRPLRITKRVLRRGKRLAVKALHPFKTLGGRPVPWMPTYSAPFSRSGSAALDMEAPNRLVIFFFYDRDGVVDRYVLKLLEAFKTTCSHLLVVVGGSLTGEGRRMLNGVCDELLVRANRGFDAWCYKAALQKIGWKRLGAYDEVVLTNHTIMGPVSPLGELFDKMNKRDVDFWGISANPGFDGDPFGCCPYGTIPEHIQSYFLAFRREMIKSEHFRKFWECLPMIYDYNQAVGRFEAVLTRWFSEAGFSWDTFLDRPAYYDLTDNPMITLPVEMLRDQRCPFFKRRAFFQDYDYMLAYTAGQPAVQLLDYLCGHTSFDVELLWENLLRTCHMSDLSEQLHLTRVLPTALAMQDAPLSGRRAAAFIHLFDTGMAEELAGYAANLPEMIDVYISTTSQEKKQAIQRAFSGLSNWVEIRVCPNRGRDVSALLTTFREDVMKYDYICVTHDKRTAYLKPETIGEGFAYNGYTNLFSSREYIANILSTFEQEPRLGLLCTPMPNHADFAPQIGLEWGMNYPNTQKLAQRLRLTVPMDKAHYPCAPYGSNFWARVDALRSLLTYPWTYGDFPEEPLTKTDGTILNAIERIYPYAAQQAGYYSAMLMTDAYSAVELGNLHFYAQSYTHMCFDSQIRGRYLLVRDVMNQKLKMQ